MGALMDQLLGIKEELETYEYYVPVNCPKCGRFVARDSVVSEGMDMTGEIWFRCYCAKCGHVRAC